MAPSIQSNPGGGALTGRLEVQMIAPTQALMRETMGLEVITEEFSAGYGIADLVGATMCKKCWRKRATLGVASPVDHRPLIEVLFALKSGRRKSLSNLATCVSFAESTLRHKVLPLMASRGFIEQHADGYVQLLLDPPAPTSSIVAVEVKQTRWREAILQARRYTFFADQTYVAVWNGSAKLVDRKMLYRHRIGLIAVEPEGAEILLEAPHRSPRAPKMHRFCAEALYRKALESKGLLSE